VAIESPHKHQYKGKLYHVVVDVHVPGKEIVVSRAPDDQQAHEDVYVAIRDAFDAARRQIQDYVRIRRGKVKAHEPPPQGA
jgi:ribosome-associated translation inhibitor RaiA